MRNSSSLAGFPTAVGLISLFCRMPLHAGESQPKPQLKAIGSLAAAHVYTSYGYVGAIADAFVADSFTGPQVTELMTELTDLIDINVKALRDVQKTVTDDDAHFISDLIVVYTLLQVESCALKAYAASNEPDDAQAFEASRTAVWPKLKALLGIE